VDIQKTNINTLWGYLIIEELARSGVSYFCISPGSRSTPLTVSAALNKSIQTIICYDERAAGFHALGYARATGKPAALICTSGTAVANYYPAVIEAHQSSLPLIILSADRPPELRATAANQTIDQVKMFGTHLNWQFDLPCPDEKIPVANLLSLIDQAIYRTSRSPAGPVQINCMFREPLEPSPGTISDAYFAYSYKRQNNHPFTAYHHPHKGPAGTDLAGLAETLIRHEKGLLVIGRLSRLQSYRHILELIQTLNWPVIVDITSGLRASIPEHLKINYCDHLLLSESFQQDLKPDFVLHLGGPLTSKRYANFINTLALEKYVQVENNPYRQDPQNVVTERFECDLDEFCRQLTAVVESGKNQTRVMRLKQYDNHAVQIVKTFVAAQSAVSEIAVAYLISRHIPSAHGLFLANSMPIRDMDMYASFQSNPVYIAANRGASGIDGNLASACGYAAGLNQPVTLVIGDLALLHDLNSLELIRKLKVPVLIVIVNNHGGGIFSFLPIANFPQVFEPYFATPHDLSFKPAAEMFKIDYYKPASNEQFRLIYQECLENKKSAIIEIITSREINLEVHQKLQKEFRELKP
jgi:2-succinyl-5-enolpyruvyl-6-hydroxy-3-cyclohexene-1-carboxylate synthase